MTPTRTALVLGATGGIGHETATALARHGWTIRALTRHTPPHDPNGWTWIQGDAMNPEAIRTAAQDAQVIVHAVNPPGYRQWAQLVLPMIDHTLQAARASGARILLPGTIYNYGPDAYPVLREDSPQRATSRKGRIRIALEQKLQAAARDGVASLTVRFGDFFGPRSGNSWFAQGLVTPGQPVRTLTLPGRRGVGHSWTYLPDAGETFARLLKREHELDRYAHFHFRGHWDADGQQMIRTIQRVTGHAALKVRPLPWFALGLAAPFNETARELYATRALWRAPVELDHSRLVQFLGAEPHTPWDAAVRTTLEGLGCLPARPA
ncbi:NAD-dependent epimerase/dehydratase family protein [Deinococcus maricopensis]|uniref:NAD-dependent epimerase/dehydratase n=1 Tax=Deinococcus maricopensis (strain DSM 21211 / LMG 22137 / NRRL B-23946 / LB-34) TaxID=709986 RepID=E8U3Y2_DEIML|nr:NAD-dependent epimerase/dehydratase family protein [Deinococcus maricopensis]ADV65676.1 NAD-dependent epimerase/dehydratase [Deinococcus maricopensis DSM 21211]